MMPLLMRLRGGAKSRRRPGTKHLTITPLILLTAGLLQLLDQDGTGPLPAGDHVPRPDPSPERDHSQRTRRARRARGGAVLAGGEAPSVELWSPDVNLRLRRLLTSPRLRTSLVT